MKKNKSKKIILYIVIFLIIITTITLILLKKIKIFNYIYNTFNSISNSKIEKNLNEEVNIEFNDNDNIIIGNKISIKLTQNVDELYNNYEINIYCDNNKISNFELAEKSKEVEINFDKEGKHSLKIDIYKGTELIKTQNNDFFVINEYKHQFAEKTSRFGMSTHFGLNYNRDSISKGLDLLFNLGIKNIRDNILWQHVDKGEGKYSYNISDSWVPYIMEKNINILALLSGGYEDENGKIHSQITSESELLRYGEYVKSVVNKYPDIIEYQIFNEPNAGWTDNSEKEWYAKSTIEVYNKLKETNKYKRTVVGSVAIKYLEEKESIDYLTDIGAKYGALKESNTFAYHMYTSQENMQRLKEVTEYANEAINNIGGFTNIYVNEMGITSSDDITEIDRIQKIIKQMVTYINYGISKVYIYDFRDTDKEDGTSRYGIVTNDYIPKESYFILKRFLENTNGAEYIGKSKNLEGIENDNLEVHVYDKDGKPKIIVWSSSSKINITVPYANFKATDLYGEEIQPDESGNLVITKMPIYIDEVDYNYFYQAISNMATEKYNEFTEKFAVEIAQVPELTSKIEENTKYMESVGQVENKIIGSATIQAMKNHFELGNLILQAYRDGKLQAEDVKISSMLDMLNDIGDSYEDLVTVSAQTVEQSEIEQTNKVIQEAETTINNNQGCEIIYPVKILDFAKDHYEKATYINSLEENNDIKNGLIISNNLHASLLANWAKTFAQINVDKFVDEYIANNPVTIEYSTTELTNQNVKATIKTNAEIQITNNSNSKEHTFEQNGSFTFEYTIKGRALNITATVQNIDKVAPSISGVQKAKVYTKPVTPKINDENLKEIKLILNSQVVTDYKNGDTLQDEGFYELTATDKAGNVTSTYFQIFINTDTEYKIENNYIRNVTNNTKKSDFYKKLNLSVGYKIYRNGIELKPDDIIATGDILITEAGDSYTIIVPGDINKDGLVNLKDFIKMRIYLLLENNLDDIEMLAADCNNDNQKVGVKDYIRMRLIILMNE